MNSRNAGGDGASGAGYGRAGASPGSDLNRVLIVAASPIIRIVVARTIERIYLKPTAVAPDAALRALGDSRPMMAIIDGAAPDGLLEPFLAELARQRDASEKRLPRVIRICEPDRREPAGFAGLADTVVPKPITPDILQPLVERLFREYSS